MRRQTIFNLRRELLICLLIAATIVTVYRQVGDYPFIRFDDNLYVTENKKVQEGLNLRNISWAFGTTHASNWHPLTWLSHMVDVSLFGMNPGAHHMVNVILHVINALMLFFVLRYMTHAVWQSGLVAALFGLHPLHVESVAWIAERKDLLSAFFWMISLFCYARYGRRLSLRWYGWAIVFFILGLLAKPMVVTLPFVLLLLDYWPLNRIRFDRQFSMQQGNEKNTVNRLLLEKVPFLLIAIASCLITYFAQKSGGAIGSFEEFSLTTRISNGIVSYVAYIEKTFWPVHLAPFYPYPASIPVWQIISASLLLICASVFVILTLKQLPFLAVGWFWYVGTLVPVIGLVQVGEQAMADRYMYIPLIGIFIILAWTVPNFLAKWPHRHIGLTLISVAVISVLMTLTWAQIQHWSSNLAFFQQWVRYAPRSPKALYNLGVEFEKRNQDREAAERYSAAIRANPNHVGAHNNLGNLWVKFEKPQMAIRHYRHALKLHPNDPEIHNNFGVALAKINKPEQAIAHFKKALELNPHYPAAEKNLKNILEKSE